jgi:hypothetical protein
MTGIGVTARGATRCTMARRETRPRPAHTGIRQMPGRSNSHSARTRDESRGRDLHTVATDMQVAYALRTHTAHGDQTRTNHHQLKASTVGQPDRRLPISLSHTTSENRPPSQQITDTPIPHPPITSHHGGDGDGVHPLALPRAPARSPPPLSVTRKLALGFDGWHAAAAR